ncbi:MAG: YqeG family HAD IIIA-type phosphatase [Bacilli bacterium]
MLTKYVPDMYYKSIYTINYEKLLNRNIKCILFDLDNTLVSASVNSTSKELKELIYNIKNMGFKVIINSNSPKQRISSFMNELCIDACAFAMKPKINSYIKIMNKYNFKPSEVASVGDRLTTDIYGANKAQVLSILVNPISTKDLFATTINRKLEKIVLNKLRKKDLFTKGVYYD